MGRPVERTGRLDRWAGRALFAVLATLSPRSVWADTQLATDATDAADAVNEGRSPGPVEDRKVPALSRGPRDPTIDPALEPFRGASIAFGVQRLQDDFGLTLKASSPRFLSDRVSVVLSTGVGWYPDLRALPEDETDQNFGAWSLYGQGRLCLEFSTRLADSSSRLYATLGPSVLLLSSHLSTTRFAFGIYGAAGVELFAGDGFQTYPFSFFFEVGAVAHDAAADVVNRSGAVRTTDTTVDRPIATGLALSGGIRIYFWR